MCKDGRKEGLWKDGGKEDIKNVLKTKQTKIKVDTEATAVGRNLYI
jgi:hypothetical protein